LRLSPLRWLIGAAACAGALAPSAQATAPRILHFANRPEFIADDTVQKFEAETGIAVTYDVYASEADLRAALGAGNPAGWDLVVASTVPTLAEAAKRRYFQPVGRDRLGNFGNLDPEILAKTAVWDPGNTVGVPYLWGTAGLAVDEEKLKPILADAPLDTLALVFDPATVARIGCGVAVEDAPELAIPAALAMQGLDPESQVPKEIDKAGELLGRLKFLVRRLPPDEFVEALASGRVCVGFGASDDVTDARSKAEDRDTGVDITYFIPRERSRMWVDVLAIPAGAAHVEEARAFIDFVLRPEIISDITDWTGAVNPNTLANYFVDDDKTDQTVFPSAESRARLFMDQPLTQEAAAARQRIWSKTKP
jgi:putrescine transport system substrate-binding protein